MFEKNKKAKDILRNSVFEQSENEANLEIVTNDLSMYLGKFDVMKDERPDHQIAVNFGFDDESYTATLEVLGHQDINEIASKVSDFVSTNLNPKLEKFEYRVQVVGTVVVVQLMALPNKMN